MLRTASQVAVLGALIVLGSLVVLGGLGGLTGCESPARVKPWRHAPDPTSEAASAPGSPALAEVSGEQEVRAARAHTLRVHVDAEPGRLTPLVAPTLWARRITLGTIFEPLVRYVPPDGQGPGRYAPRLAQSWRVMPSGLEVRIELSPDVTFHDGHPFTAADVQFTLDAVRDPRKGIDHLRRGLAASVLPVFLTGGTSLDLSTFFSWFSAGYLYPARLLRVPWIARTAKSRHPRRER